MAVLQPPQGPRSFCALIAAALGLLVMGMAAQCPAEEPAIRGQSPVQNWLSSRLPAEQTFGASTSPWISISQEANSPPPPSIAQHMPSDPFGGAPGYGSPPPFGDPALGGYFANTAAIWQPYVAAQGKAGNQNASIMGQLMMPLYQDGQSLIFADIRGRWDDHSNSEGNFGLALRKLVDPTWLWGINSFYDHRHTQYGNNFDQATVGIEAMSVQWEARMNGYIPFGGTKRADAASFAEIDNTTGTIFVRGGIERAYHGLDGEIGGLMWEEWGGNLELRGFVGGYWFEAGDSRFPSISGPRGRLEVRWYDLPWFGPQSRLTVGVEMQDDKVRDFQVAGLARLEIPLGVFPATRNLSRIERRMLDRIIRDDDIITVATQGAREVGRDALTGRLLNNVTYADKTFIDANGGLANVVATAGATPNSTVIVDGRAGAISADSVQVLPDQVLRGGGFVVIGTATGSTTTLGYRPTLVNETPATDTIILADYATVADINIVTDPALGNNGITSGGFDLFGVTVSGTSVTGAATAYQFNAIDATSTIQNNTAQATTGNAFEFNGSVNGKVVNNTSIDPGNDGFAFNDLVTFAPVGPLGVVSGNRAIRNANAPANGNGFTFVGDVLGAVSNNTATGHSVDGFNFSTGSIFGTLSHNTASNNAGNGFTIEAVALGGKVLGNTASFNQGTGFLFNNTVDFGGLVDGNTASYSGLDSAGQVVNLVDGFTFSGGVSGTVSNNVSQFNALNGYYVNGLTSTGVVSGNSASSNGDTGFLFGPGAGDLEGIVSGNSASNSADGYGFDFTQTTIAALGRVINNTATFNDAGGFGFGTIAPGTPPAAQIIGNTASSNGLLPGGAVTNALANGFNFTADNDGVVTGNIASGNANNGYANDDADFNNNAGAFFTSNIANSNNDMGYRVFDNGGDDFPVNTGAGNLNGGDTFP